MRKLLICLSIAVASGNSNADPLPEHMVLPVTLSRATALEAVRTILSQARIPFRLEQPLDMAEAEVRLPAGQTLDRAMEQISDLYGFYYEFDNSLVRINTLRDHVVPAQPGLADRLRRRGAKAVAENAGQVRFQATAAVARPFLVQMQPEPTVLHERGARPARIDPVAHAGTDVPLGDALRRIIPDPRWRGQASPPIEPIPRVSWTGQGRAWPEVIAELLRAHALQADLDWDARTLTVRRSVNQPASNPSPVERPIATIDVAKAAKPPEPILPEKPPEPIKPRWEILAEDRALRTVFERWVKAANLRLAWDVPWDYELAFQASFDGTLEQAMLSVIAALRSEKRVEVIFHELNGVVQVTPVGSR